MIELLIVITLISLLASIAFPSYQEHIYKTERYKAQLDLYKLQLWMEQKFTQEGQYPTQILCAECELSKLYDYSIQIDHDGAKFELAATPKTNSSQQNDECFTQLLNQASVQSNRSKTGKIIEVNCWKE